MSIKTKKQTNTYLKLPTLYHVGKKKIYIYSYLKAFKTLMIYEWAKY